MPIGRMGLLLSGAAAVAAFASPCGRLAEPAVRCTPRRRLRPSDKSSAMPGLAPPAPPTDGWLGWCPGGGGVGAASPALVIPLWLLDACDVLASGLALAPSGSGSPMNGRRTLELPLAHPWSRWSASPRGSALQVGLARRPRRCDTIPTIRPCRRLGRHGLASRTAGRRAGLAWRACPSPLDHVS